MIELRPLLTLVGTATIENLGKVQDGERLKIETRAKDAPGSPIAGKARWTDWILVGPLGPGETSSVCEVTTADRQRLVLELRGYARSRNGDGMEIRTCGIIRSASPRFSERSGHVAVAMARIDPEHHVEIAVYEL